MSLFLLFKKTVCGLLITRLLEVIFVAPHSQLSREMTVRVFIFTTMALLLSDTGDRRINISGVASS